MKHIDPRVAFFAAGLLSGAAAPFVVASLFRVRGETPRPVEETAWVIRYVGDRPYLTSRNEPTEWVPLGV